MRRSHPAAPWSCGPVGRKPAALRRAFAHARTRDGSSLPLGSSASGGGLIPPIPRHLGHLRPVALLHPGVVVLLVRTGPRHPNPRPLTVAPQQVVDHAAVVVRMQFLERKRQSSPDAVQPCSGRPLRASRKGNRRSPLPGSAPAAPARRSAPAAPSASGPSASCPPARIPSVVPPGTARVSACPPRLGSFKPSPLSVPHANFGHFFS